MSLTIEGHAFYHAKGAILNDKEPRKRSREDKDALLDLIMDDHEEWERRQEEPKAPDKAAESDWRDRADEDSLAGWDLSETLDEEKGWDEMINPNAGPETDSN